MLRTGIVMLVGLGLSAGQQGQPSQTAAPGTSASETLKPAPVIPATGEVKDKTYVNDEVGMRVPVPEGWSLKQRVDRGMLDLKLAPPFGAAPAAIEVTVIDTSIHTQLASGQIGRKQDIERKLQPDAGLEQVQLGGVSCERSNYHEETPGAMPYQARLSALVRGWRLLMIVDSSSKASLDDLVRGLAQMQFSPTHATVGIPPKIIRVQSGVVAGRLVKRVEPEYPTIARNGKIQGTVVLIGIIGKDGKVKDLKPISGDQSLVPAAMQAVRQWEYSPYLLDGRPVEVETTISVNFVLRGIPPR